MNAAKRANQRLSERTYGRQTYLCGTPRLKLWSVSEREPSMSPEAWSAKIDAQARAEDASYE